jgi:hypothetical protein
LLKEQGHVRNLRMMHIAIWASSLIVGFERGGESMRKKRNLFNELMEGFEALADQRTGKRTVRTHAVKPRSAPQII